MNMIETIKESALFALAETMSLFKKDNIDVSIALPLERSDFEHLVNLVTAVYLEAWLERDENAKQTIHSFAKNKYILQTEYEPTSHLSAHDYQIKALQRAEKAYIKMQTKRILQSEKEKSAAATLPTLQNTYRGKKYSFPALRHMDLLANRNLDLYRLLTGRTEIMTVSTHRVSEKHDTLLACYDSYEAVFEQAKNISSDREYVSACIHMRKFESAFRFHLIARLAVYLVENDISPDAIDSLTIDNFKLLWGRFSLNLVDGIDADIIREPYDILFYDEKIKSAFSGNDLSFDSFYRDFFQITVSAKLNQALPVNKQPSWTDEDFAAAAKFFREDYQTFESHVPLWTSFGTIPSTLASDKDIPVLKKKEYAELIVDIYKKISEISESDLNHLRVHIKPQKGRSY